MNQEQIERIEGDGFIAALDQSGGSTPKALEAYGISPEAWEGDQAKMFELVHGMRTRIITNPAFNQRISGAILFENTMLGEVERMPTAQYLWERKKIVPFLKIDDGLAEKKYGVQLMKPIEKLEERLQDARNRGMFGTKMRSVIHAADGEAIRSIVDQQFQVAQKIIAAGLMPIIEPEIGINIEGKKRAEELLIEDLFRNLDLLPTNQKVMLKLTLPESTDFYLQLTQHPSVLRVVALSGGYSREEASKRLAQNTGMTASFSRALVDGLRVDQTKEKFTETLNASIKSIYDASMT